MRRQPQLLRAVARSADERDPRGRQQRAARGAAGHLLRAVHRALRYRARADDLRRRRAARKSVPVVRLRQSERVDRRNQRSLQTRRILMAVMDATLPSVRHARVDKSKGILGWITTVDHKKIAIMYLFTTFFFFLIGGVMALLIRIQLAEPQNTFLTPEQYNQIFTMHGTTMIFLWIIPVWAGFGNYMVPLMIGARDMAFPRINALSFWLVPLGGIVMYSGFLVPAVMGPHGVLLCPGGPGDAGWTGYVPLTGSHYSCSMGQDLWIVGLHLVGISSMLGGVNFLA